MDDLDSLTEQIRQGEDLLLNSWFPNGPTASQWQLINTFLWASQPHEGNMIKPRLRVFQFCYFYTGGFAHPEQKTEQAKISGPYMVEGETIQDAEKAARSGVGLGGDTSSRDWVFLLREFRWEN